MTDSSPRRPTPAPLADLVRASRRQFIRGGSLGLVLAGGSLLAAAASASRGALGDGPIRVGLIGCGRRGIAAANQILKTEGGPLRLVAMADLAGHQLQAAYRTINGAHGGRVELETRRFVGDDAAQHLINCDLDVVIVATPAAARPEHFERAVLAGKHVYMENPVASDPSGVRRILAANAHAIQQNLAVAVGFQRRDDRRWLAFWEQLRGGVIGTPIGAERLTAGAAGELAMERLVHDLELVNDWLVGHPVAASRQQDDESSSFWFRYSDDRLCRIGRTGDGDRSLAIRPRPGLTLIGSEGTCHVPSGTIHNASGRVIRRPETRATAGAGCRLRQEALVAAMRTGEPLNEVETGVASTMTAILGQIVRHSQPEARWDEALASDWSVAARDAVAVPSAPA